MKSPSGKHGKGDSRSPSRPASSHVPDSLPQVLLPAHRVHPPTIARPLLPRLPPPRACDVIALIWLVVMFLINMNSLDVNFPAQATGPESCRQWQLFEGPTWHRW